MTDDDIKSERLDQLGNSIMNAASLSTLLCAAAEEERVFPTVEHEKEHREALHYGLYKLQLMLRDTKALFLARNRP